MACLTTVLCLLLGFPVAYYMTRAKEKVRKTLLIHMEGTITTISSLSTLMIAFTLFLVVVTKRIRRVLISSLQKKTAQAARPRVPLSSSNRDQPHHQQPKSRKWLKLSLCSSHPWLDPERKKAQSPRTFSK
ncbi:MAG: hypothetical protein R6T89_00015 [Candidatus Syntrophosphaera sp.]